MDDRKGKFRRAMDVLTSLGWKANVVIGAVISYTGYSLRDVPAFLRAIHWTIRLASTPVPAAWLIASVVSLGTLSAALGALLRQARRMLAEERASRLAPEGGSPSAPDAEVPGKRKGTPRLKIGQYTEDIFAVNFDRVGDRGHGIRGLKFSWGWDGDSVVDIAVHCTCGRKLEYFPPSSSATARASRAEGYKCPKCGRIYMFQLQARLADFANAAILDKAANPELWQAAVLARRGK